MPNVKVLTMYDFASKCNILHFQFFLHRPIRSRAIFFKVQKGEKRRKKNYEMSISSVAEGRFFPESAFSSGQNFVKDGLKTLSGACFFPSRGRLRGV